ncbi:RseA family anti-sigma factor [Utexia brackfieldae]|uniref:RseA family anti-sigma factor n=1 Tax=Utexia brackfieldae TaxID=3074108 RepID=UPI00370D32DC
MQKEKLSSFMDGELEQNSKFISSLLSDKEMQACWHRYHLTRDVLHHSLHEQMINLSLSEKIALAITDEKIEPEYQNQSIPTAVKMPDTKKLFWPKLTEFGTRIAQVGFAACITLSIIAGVQYYASKNESVTGIPTFNTQPVGVGISPVGGMNSVVESPDYIMNGSKLSQEQYEKISILLQDYELQKRLNANH